MDFKQFNGTIWETIPYKKYDTDTQQFIPLFMQAQINENYLFNNLVFNNTIQNKRGFPQQIINIISENKEENINE